MVLLFLIFDLLKNKRLLNIPVIISIISFHMYGMVQSMQYIPMIWLVDFLESGLCHDLDEGVLPMRVKAGLGRVDKGECSLGGNRFFCVFEEILNPEVLHRNMGSASMPWTRIGIDSRDFFNRQKDGNMGIIGGSGKSGAVYFSDGGEVALEFYCRTPGLKEDPVILTVFHDGKLLDTISFTKEGSVKKEYALPKTPGEDQELLLEVSRTWIPQEHLGNFDRRKLGVGVKVKDRS